VDAAALDWLADRALATLARDERPGADWLVLLLRRYAATGRADLSDALGPALAAALDQVAPRAGGLSAPVADLPGWLALFAEASALSADPRLRDAAVRVADALEHGWPAAASVGGAMASVRACLVAAATLDDAALVQRALDELERIIGRTYRPGGGVLHDVDEVLRRPGTLRDHTAAARALLTAHAATARLPYSMLAEELMQHVRRTWWDERLGSFGEASAAFAANCEAAEVLCALARLHDDPGYRSAAVIVPASDYAADARRTLATLSHVYRQQGSAAAQYGLALGECIR
jgi:hypothetical protein